MTVESVIQPDIYQGDGATRDWTITFSVENLTETDFEIYVEEGGVSEIVTTGYEVDLVTPQVTYPTVESGIDLLTSAQKIVIKPVLPLKQEFIDVATQGAIPLPSIEAGFDRLILIAQQMQEEIGRCAKSDIAGGSVDDYITALKGYVDDAEEAAEDAESAVEDAEDARDLAQQYAIAAESAIGGIMATFDNDDLEDGILTITHALGLEAPYIIDFEICDNDNKIIIPDEVTFSENTITVDISSFGEITGNWGYRYGGIATTTLSIATEAQALSGVDNSVIMTPLRVKEAFDGFVTDKIFQTGMVILWSGSISTIPDGWALCDGNNGTPDLRDRFIVGANQDDGGVAKTNVTGSLTKTGDGTIPAHDHGSAGAHTHNYDKTTGTEGATSSGVYIHGTLNTRFTYTSTATSSSGAHTHDSFGTGTKNIAVYYALAYIMKT